MLYALAYARMLVYVLVHVSITAAYLEHACCYALSPQVAPHHHRVHTEQDAVRLVCGHGCVGEPGLTRTRATHKANNDVLLRTCMGNTYKDTCTNTQHMVALSTYLVREAACYSLACTMNRHKL